MSALVPGAGVDPAKVFRPGKRIRNLYRKHGRSVHGLRAFARGVCCGPVESDARIAARWLAGKGFKP